MYPFKSDFEEIYNVKHYSSNIFST